MSGNIESLLSYVVRREGLDSTAGVPHLSFHKKN